MLGRAMLFLNNLAGMSENEVSRYFIGAGSTRDAYRFEDKYIIKVPRFVVRFPNIDDYTAEQVVRIIQRGVAQTQTEIKVYTKCPVYYKYLLNPVLCYGEFLGMPFVVMPKLKIASEVMPFDVANVNQFLEWYDLLVPRNFHSDLLHLSVKYNLYHSDLCDNTDNFGINFENRFLISDYGTIN